MDTNATTYVLDYYPNDTINSSSSMQQPVEDCTVFLFVFYTILIGTLSTLGILGNLLSIAVLQKDRHNRVAVFLLQSLALADTFVLFMSLFILSMIYSLLPFIDQDYQMGQLVPYVAKYINPVGYMAQCASIWITVLLAINRYIAIVKPFHVLKWCTLTKARIQVLTVVVMAVGLNIPRFFQYHIVHTQDTSGGVVVTLNGTTIGENSVFGVVFTNIFYTILVLLIPIVILVVLNSRLIHELKFDKSKSKSKSKSNIESRKKRVGFRIERQVSFTKPPLPEEDNITFIMVIIIVVLIVCHTPDRIFFIYRYFFTSPHDQPLLCGQTLYYVYNICNLLIVVNSSCNFVIYFLLRRRFRQTLKNKICAWTKFKKYREPPSFLEAQSPVALLERQSDFGITYKTPAERDQGFSNFSFKSTRLKSPSVPCL